MNRRLAILSLIACTVVLPGCSWAEYDHTNPDGSVDRLVVARNLFDAKYTRASCTLPTGVQFQIDNYEGAPDAAALQLANTLAQKLVPVPAP